MSKSTKTNAMRILDRAAIEYKALQYPHGGVAVEGEQVAFLMGEDPARVFKTLVAKGRSGEHYVFDIPVCCHLDLKKAARVVGEKSMEMVPAKDLLKICGYTRGNVSPVGMKSNFKTVFHSTAADFDSIYISAGKIGTQVQLDPKALLRLLSAGTADIVV